MNKWLDSPVNHVLPGTHLPGYTFFCILKNDIISWRCLHCSFCAWKMLALFFLCMLCIHHCGHDNMTIVLEDACIVLFRTWWDFWESAAEMKACSRWLGVGFKACCWHESWQLKKSRHLTAVLLIATTFGRLSFQQFFHSTWQEQFFRFLCAN